MSLSGILLTIRLNWNENSRWVGRSAVAGLAGGYSVTYMEGSAGIESMVMAFIIYLLAVAGSGFYQYYYPEEDDKEEGRYTKERIESDSNQ